MIFSLTSDWVEANSNLALKGIIGIYAMGEISKLLGSLKRASHYLVGFLFLSFAAKKLRW